MSASAGMLRAVPKVADLGAGPSGGGALCTRPGLQGSSVDGAAYSSLRGGPEVSVGPRPRRRRGKTDPSVLIVVLFLCVGTYLATTTYGLAILVGAGSLLAWLITWRVLVLRRRYKRSARLQRRNF
jgi:hypothetical protein